MDHRVCLPDYNPLLPELATILGAELDPRRYDRDYDAFLEPNEDYREWVLLGAHGKFTIEFEKYEGYFFATLEASGDVFKEASRILRAEAARTSG